MKTEMNPIVKRTAERIRHHSEKIREAQEQLRLAIRAAERDRVTEEQLYC